MPAFRINERMRHGRLTLLRKVLYRAQQNHHNFSCNAQRTRVLLRSIHAGKQVPSSDCRPPRLAIVCALTAPAAAQTSSTVAGTVKDTQGGIIPGATVTLVSETRGTTFEAVAEQHRRLRHLEHARGHLHHQSDDGRVQDDGAQRRRRSALASAWRSAPSPSRWARWPRRSWSPAMRR